ncbi:ATP-binding protein [Streptomyces sp. NPDC047042]|uniref:ATP-binding protein n=1 Tax=Streptomyces sp. NPDC047042 TaxID=3154807 RepID=UPI00340E6230
MFSPIESIHPSSPSRPCEGSEQWYSTKPPSPIQAPTHQASLTLVADDKAPRAARSFTRSALAAWDMEDLLDRTVLIVSELTTNAERHGRRPAWQEPPGGTGQDSAEQITLTLAVQADLVGIEVEDNSPLLPMPRASSPQDTSGRGLQLVSAAADVWMVRPNEDGTGKRVLAFVQRPGSFR